MAAIVAMALPQAAFADSVPLDALGAVGDEEIVTPPYSSTSVYEPPTASAADVGDVNGDGISDTGIVLPDWRPDSRSSAWITFSPGTLPVSMATTDDSWHGIQITGNNLMIGVLAGLGDVNGDGLAEVVVGERQQGQTGAPDYVPPRLAVVFGRADGGTVDIDHLGSDGFYIDNAYTTAAEAGYADTGTIGVPHGVLDVGDQNGDGSPDLAFVTGDRDGSAQRFVEVAYTPASPAGAEIDALDLGSNGYRLATGDWSQTLVSSLGDINSDSRQDLVVFWQTGDEIQGTASAHAAGVIAPAAGTTLHLADVASQGRGFELVRQGAGLIDGVSVGDQNDDGKTDVAMVTEANWPAPDRVLTIAYAPALGSTVDLYPTAPANGIDAPDELWATDIGDQDNDGRDDIGDGDCARFSTADFHGCGITTAIRGVDFVGSTADRNGDGRRELLVAYANPYSDSPPTFESTWREQVYLSASQPVSVSVDPPQTDGDLIDFGGSFRTGKRGGMRTLAARGYVRLQGVSGPAQVVRARSLLNANSRTADASIRVDAGKLDLGRGRPYGYRLMLKNSRGLIGTSPMHWFVYGGPADLHVVSGSPGADRLHGSARADLIRAGAGGDVINSRDGRRDWVLCGAGIDHVAADTVDRAYGCESVRRQ